MIIEISFIFECVINYPGNFFGYNCFSGILVFLSELRLVEFTNNRVVVDSMHCSIGKNNFQVFVAVFWSSFCRDLPPELQAAGTSLQ